MPFCTVPLAPTLTVVAVPFKTAPAFKLMARFSVAVGAVKVKFPLAAFVLASIAAFTVIEFAACKLTFVPFKAETIVPAPIVEAAGSLFPATIVPPAPATTSRSTGSITQFPVNPFAAVVITFAVGAILICALPDVSTNPPFPPNSPPFALIIPLKFKLLSA